MSGYHNNLALHISEATLKARRRLDHEQPTPWGYLLAAVLGAGALWAIFAAAL